MSLQMTDIFNPFFSTGVFHSGLKIAKVMPIDKKELKLRCQNYRPMSLLSNLDNLLEELMYNISFDV